MSVQILLSNQNAQISKPRKRRSGGACAPPSQGTNGPLHRQPTSMRSRHKTSPCTALAAILSCATTTRAQNTGHARCARRQRGCRLAKSPATPLRTPGCQVGDPTLHPLTLREGARRRTSRAFALDQRPVCRDELDHGQPSPPESTKVNATIGELEGLVGADFQTCAQRRRG